MPSPPRRVGSVLGLDSPGPTEVPVGRPVGQLGGSHHLAVYVEDADEAIVSFAVVGYGVIQEGRGFGPDGDGAFAYFDTEHDLGYLLEVVQRPGTRREPDLMIQW